MKKPKLTLDEVIKKHKLDREGNYIYLGDWDFGTQVISLLAHIGTASGSVCSSFAQKKNAPKAYHSKVEGKNYITVGVNHHRWRHCLAVLMHEALEFAFMEMGLRFQYSPRWSDSHANYSFLMTHEQFSEAVDRSAEWIAFAQVEMAKVHKQTKFLKDES